MNSDQANKIVFITAAVLVAAAFLENHYDPSSKSMFKRVWTIGLLTVLLGITADFVPEVAGPLALLVITSVAVKDSQYFGQAIGTKKAGS